MRVTVAAVLNSSSWRRETKSQPVSVALCTEWGLHRPACWHLHRARHVRGHVMQSDSRPGRVLCQALQPSWTSHSSWTRLRRLNTARQHQRSFAFSFVRHAIRLTSPPNQRKGPPKMPAPPLAVWVRPQVGDIHVAWPPSARPNKVRWLALNCPPAVNACDRCCRAQQFRIAT
jgi:hypothetical protein